MQSKLEDKSDDIPARDGGDDLDDDGPGLVFHYEIGIAQEPSPAQPPPTPRPEAMQPTQLPVQGERRPEVQPAQTPEVETQVSAKGHKRKGKDWPSVEHTHHSQRMVPSQTQQPGSPTLVKRGRCHPCKNAPVPSMRDLGSQNERSRRR